jgi:hypothetical protein
MLVVIVLVLPFAALALSPAGWVNGLLPTYPALQPTGQVRDIMPDPAAFAVLAAWAVAPLAISMTVRT